MLEIVYSPSPEINLKMLHHDYQHNYFIADFIWICQQVFKNDNIFEILQVGVMALYDLVEASPEELKMYSEK